MALARNPPDEHHAALLELIRANPTANGLALIVANRRETHGLKPLLGVENDFKTMTSTFKQLKFAVFPGLFDVSSEYLMSLLRTVARYSRYPDSYRRLVFTFSGHGLLHRICTHTGDLEIQSFIDLFEPEAAPLLGNIPKFFFIDACQGDTEMHPIVVPRGGRNIGTLSAPRGNYLIALSTLPQFMAFETKESGGIWMSILSQKLLTSYSTVSVVLEEVNIEMKARLQLHSQGRPCQQPLMSSTINESVKLLVEAGNGTMQSNTGSDLHQHSPVALSGGPTNMKQRRVGAGVERSHSVPSTGSQSAKHIPPRSDSMDVADASHSSSQGYKYQLEQLKQEGCIRGYEYCNGNARMYVKLILCDNTTLSCAPAEESVHGRAVREAAAKIAVEYVAEQVPLPSVKGDRTVVEPWPLPVSMAREFEPVTPRSVPAVEPMKQRMNGSPTVGPNFRQELNNWCQKHNIKYTDCREYKASPQCSFSYTLNKQFRRFESNPHPTRKEAEEEVARRVLEYESLEQAFASKGHADRPPKKILQEWCSKKHLENPTFTTSNVSEQTFQSTVSVHGLQALQGCISGTKTGAENSVSLIVLSALGEI